MAGDGVEKASRRTRFFSWLGRRGELLIQTGLLMAAIFAGYEAIRLGNTAHQLWQNEVDKRRFESTLKYLDQMLQREYVDNLWDLQEFTICFENKRGAGRHLSYLPFDFIKNDFENLALARQWWNTLENDDRNDCKEVPQLERKLQIVYSRWEALASCIGAKFCDEASFQKMFESFDYLTFLSISNYLLLSASVSREWGDPSDNFRNMVLFIENQGKSFLERPGKTRELWKGRKKPPPRGRNKYDR
jgi:hypothetical protein